MRLDVRAEVFNLFNRVVWGAPEQNFNSANFGLITSSRTRRGRCSSA